MIASLLAGGLLTVALSGGGRGEVVLVDSPGLAPAVADPMERALTRRRFRVHRVRVGCGAADAVALSGAIAEVIRGVEQPIVVAHGLGATLALSSGAAARGWVLVGPVLDALPVADTLALVGRPIGPTVQLAAATGEDAALAARLVGPGPVLDCAPGPLAAEVLAWVAHGPAPLSMVPAGPARVVLGAGDDVAPVEAVVPVASGWPGVEITRVGLGSFHRVDPDHAALFTDRATRRAARRAVVELSR